MIGRGGRAPQNGLIHTSACVQTRTWIRRRRRYAFYVPLKRTLPLSMAANAKLQITRKTAITCKTTNYTHNGKLHAKLQITRKTANYTHNEKCVGVTDKMSPRRILIILSLLPSVSASLRDVPKRSLSKTLFGEIRESLIL